MKQFLAPLENYLGKRPRSDLALLFFSTLWAYLTIHPGRMFEDAAMLLRYAEHIANGAGYVWNVGGPPVDGATDFLFLLAVALAAKCGLPLEFAAKCIGLVSWLAMLWLLFDVLLRRTKIGVIPALTICFFVCVGPGTKYIEADFGTTFFAFLCLGFIWLLYFVFESEQPLRDNGWIIGFSWLALGLSRPEGVILGALLLLGFLPSQKVSGSSIRAQILFKTCAVMLICGGAYFFWHWRTFGAPLPNPFYVKSKCAPYWPLLDVIANNIKQLAGPLLLLAAVPFFFKKPKPTTSSAVVLLPSIFFFSLLWIMVSDEQNFLFRYQFVLLPIVAIQAAIGVGYLSKEMTRFFLALVALAGVINAKNMLVHDVNIVPIEANLIQVGERLAPFEAKSPRRMAISECGLLPFYSKWQTLDAWGLNSPSIAHRGFLTIQDLNNFNPDLIMFNDVQDLNLHSPIDIAFEKMIITLRNYASVHGYTRVGEFDPDSDHFVYYLKNGAPNFRDLRSAIASCPNFVPYSKP